MKTEKKLAIYKAIMGQGENVTADGGALVDQPKIDIVSPDFMQGTIYERCLKMNVSNEGISLTRYNTGSVIDSSFWGASAYWVEEGEHIDKSKITFTNKGLGLNKLAVKIPVTNEIVQDAEALPTYINEVGGAALRYQIDRAIIYGSKWFSMGGIVGGGDEATIYVAAGATDRATLAKMEGSYYGGKGACWVFSQDIWAALVIENMTDAAQEFIKWDKEDAYIHGHIVKVLPAGNTTCIVLGDFSQYQIIQKELRREVSENVYFDSDQSCVRLIARVQGAPLWSGPTTIEDGSVVAPFVAVDSMENEEVSSEHWNESSSSDSSSSDSSSLNSSSSDSSDSSSLNSSSSESSSSSSVV